MIKLTAPTFFLYGPPATGKSTCARNLAAALGKTALDLDALVEQRLGMTIPQYVEKAGPEAFRDEETAALEALCQTRPNAVIALGGGTLLRPHNRAIAEDCGPIVCIRTPVDILARRVERKAGSRPWSKNADHLKKTLEERHEHYASFPLCLDLEKELSPQEVWPKVMALFGRYVVSGMGDAYPVIIAPGAFEELPRVLALLDPPPRHLLLVGDSNTLPLYGNAVIAALGTPCTTFEIVAGEISKTVETVSHLWQAMSDAKLERGDLVIALGGGVVSDLTGFAAATWLRGIRWLNLPTSLLAMVDAGIGGKTGADLPSGKNLIGAFHPPCAVISDTTTLATLPDREMRCGLAETYKHAVVGDRGLAEMLEQFSAKRNDIDFMTRLVIRSAGVKVRTIIEDPFETTGRRAALNLGHTMGHAVEAASHFQIAHGEAVAIGIVAATRISEQMKVAPVGLSETITQQLSALGLPTEIPPQYSAEELKAYLSHDKKKSEGVVRFVLPVAIGDVQTGCIVPQEVLNGILTQKRI
ncbi:MAG: 3-dehydroquinate synthase [Kiritimatiellia bacterium]